MNRRVSNIARALFDRGQVGLALAQMRKDGFRPSPRDRALLKKALGHAEKAMACKRHVLADLRALGSDMDIETIRLAEKAATGTRQMAADLRAILADDDERKTARILNTWAAADERRF